MSTNKRLTDVVILGGGYAGLLSAFRLAGKNKPKQMRITLVNGADHFVERIRLHQLAAGQPQIKRPLAEMLAGTGVEFVQGWVTEIRPYANQVQVQTAAGASQLTYDYLVYALGSTIDTSLIPDVADYAYALANEESSLALQERLAQLKPHGRVLVIGGGLTGIELTTEIAESYPQLDVRVATSGRLGDNLSTKAENHLLSVFDELDITVMAHTPITHITAAEAHTADGRTIPFDICVWAGAFTVPTLAREAGLLVNAQGQIRVDGYLRAANYPNVYAVGDAAATGLRMACATAMPQGAYAASHLVARLSQQTIKPFAFAYALRCISLGRKNGLVQFVHKDDTVKEMIVSGWLAARIKEMICRFTIFGLKLEKRLAGSYWWPEARLAELEKSEYPDLSLETK